MGFLSHVEVSMDASVGKVATSILAEGEHIFLRPAQSSSQGGHDEAVPMRGNEVPDTKFLVLLVFGPSVGRPLAPFDVDVFESDLCRGVLETAKLMEMSS